MTASWLTAILGSYDSKNSSRACCWSKISLALALRTRASIVERINSLRDLLVSPATSSISFSSCFGKDILIVLIHTLYGFDLIYVNSYVAHHILPTNQKQPTDGLFLLLR